MKRKIVAVFSALIFGLTLTACTDKNVDTEAYKEVTESASNRDPYLPKNDVEFNNYNKAQELYDSPESIIWCTTTWGNASAPLVTVPIAGKLTSSSTSYFPNNTVQFAKGSDWLMEARSVDGMFHGNPPGYRYGFTPGGQYVDFFNMPTFCTTSLTEFQRQETIVSVSNDDTAIALQDQAQEALLSGDQAGAEKILEGLK